jgi:asparagine synthase (glutamine-hydrolysing)
MIGLSACPPDAVDPFLDLRVIDFVLSLPSKPWLDRKHLLREAMIGLLPEEARLRQKVPAGNFIAPIVNSLPGELLNDWRSAPELATFLDRSKVPVIDAEAEGLNTYINLRPLMLNQWLTELKSWLPTTTI